MIYIIIIIIIIIILSCYYYYLYYYYHHYFILLLLFIFLSLFDLLITFLSELGRRISVVTGDMRETTFFFQHLSMAIQRFNCILFKSSFIDGENVPESFLFE